VPENTGVLGGTGFASIKASFDDLLLGRELMRALQFLMVMLLGFSLVSCGKQETNSNTASFDQYVNAHDGVEFKSPNKLNNGQFQNNGNTQNAEILLTLDSNRTFHIRSKVPASVYNKEQELSGVKGQWEVDSQGQMFLKRNGKVIAQTNNYYGYQQQSGNMFNLQFTEAVIIEVVQSNGQMQGYNGNLTSFAVMDYSLQGTVTVQR
jgi:hypothetical protein